VDSSIRMKNEISIIGASVKMGAAATNTPSLALCWSVCVTTNVIRGPGEKPAERPNIPPTNNAVYNCAASLFEEIQGSRLPDSIELKVLRLSKGASGIKLRYIDGLAGILFLYYSKDDASINMN